MRDVTLRPFPHPFRCALAICSDIDQCDKKTFVQIHRFLNKEKQLGLPVADSFFGVSTDPNQLALFRDWEGKKSEDFYFILDAIRAGLIDSIHTWGDCNQDMPSPVKLKTMAQRISDLLAENGLSIPIWINHGAPSNLQNLKVRLFQHWQGDTPGSAYFTLPEIQRLGVKYYWANEVFPWPLSQANPQMLKMGMRLTKNLFKNGFKRITGRGWKVLDSSWLKNLANKTVLGSGQALYGFSRYNRHPEGPWTIPTRETLRFALTDQFLKELIDSNGNAILYTHLGLPLHNTLKFSKPDQTALENLARCYHDGYLWVATTSELLRYWDLKMHLCWTAHTSEGKTVINIQGKMDLNGQSSVVTVQELQGLAFICPLPENTVVRLNGEQIETTPHGPDWQSNPSITIGALRKPQTGMLD